MSRFSDYDEAGEDFPGQWELWQANARRALKGKRGRKTLADLRAALLALPEKRLISRAMCTVNAPKRREATSYDFTRCEIDELIDEQGEGVCAVGAYLWHQRVKAGADPVEAFDTLPLLIDTEEDLDATARLAASAGVVYSLAWELAYRNDETYETLTPEQRHAAFIEWIDTELATA